MIPSLAYIMASTAMDMIKARPELWEAFRESCGSLFTIECGDLMNARIIDEANKMLWADFDKLEELARQILRIPDAVLAAPPKVMKA